MMKLNDLFRAVAFIFKPQPKPRVIPNYYVLMIPNVAHIAPLEINEVKLFNAKINKDIDDALQANPGMFGEKNVMLDTLLPFRNLTSDGIKWHLKCATGEKTSSCDGAESLFDTRALKRLLSGMRADLDAYIANYRPIDRTLDFRRPSPRLIPEKRGLMRNQNA